HRREHLRDRGNYHLALVVVDVAEVGVVPAGNGNQRFGLCGCAQRPSAFAMASCTSFQACRGIEPLSFSRLRRASNISGAEAISMALASNSSFRNDGTLQSS